MTVHDDLATLRRAISYSRPDYSAPEALSRVKDEIARLEAQAASWQASCEAARDDFETAHARAEAAEAEITRLEQRVTTRYPRPDDAHLIALAPDMARLLVDAMAALRLLDHSEDECAGECAVTRGDLCEQLDVRALLARFAELEQRAAP